MTLVVRTSLHSRRHRQPVKCLVSEMIWIRAGLRRQDWWFIPRPLQSAYQTSLRNIVNPGLPPETVGEQFPLLRSMMLLSVPRYCVCHGVNVKTEESKCKPN